MNVKTLGFEARPCQASTCMVPLNGIEVRYTSVTQIPNRWLPNSVVYIRRMDTICPWSSYRLRRTSIKSELFLLTLSDEKRLQELEQTAGPDVDWGRHRHWARVMEIRRKEDWILDWAWEIDWDREWKHKEAQDELDVVVGGRVRLPVPDFSDPKTLPYVQAALKDGKQRPLAQRPYKFKERNGC